MNHACVSWVTGVSDSASRFSPDGTRLASAGELELLSGHECRLSLEPVISGQFKPGAGWLADLIRALSSGLVASVKRSFRTRPDRIGD